MSDFKLLIRLIALNKKTLKKFTNICALNNARFTQDDMEIMECFKSESDEDPLGDSPRIDSAQEEREEVGSICFFFKSIFSGLTNYLQSIELTAIDAAATVPEAPIITTEMIK